MRRFGSTGCGFGVHSCLWVISCGFVVLVCWGFWGFGLGLDVLVCLLGFGFLGFCLTLLVFRCYGLSVVVFTLALNWFGGFGCAFRLGDFLFGWLD